jgi:hypothetical protein
LAGEVLGTTYNVPVFQIIGRAAQAGSSVCTIRNDCLTLSLMFAEPVNSGTLISWSRQIVSLALRDDI